MREHKGQVELIAEKKSLCLARQTLEAATGHEEVRCERNAGKVAQVAGGVGLGLFGETMTQASVTMLVSAAERVRRRAIEAHELVDEVEARASLCVLKVMVVKQVIARHSEHVVGGDGGGGRGLLVVGGRGPACVVGRGRLLK